MLTVAPKGIVNEAIELCAPTLVRATFRVIGIVALLDEVLKANNNAGRMFLNRVSGFKRVSRANILVYTTLAWRNRTNTIVPKYSARLIMAENPWLVNNFANRQNTP